jgi:hypothetical protein
MFGPKLYHNRTQRPAWWLRGARQQWELRCQGRLPSDLVQLEQIVQQPSDLAPFLALLYEQKQYVDPIHLATRPSYMSKEGPQAEPCHTSYLSLFERLILSSEAIATMTPQEVDELLAPYQVLVQFAIVSPLIKARWTYERERITFRRRTKFCQALRDEIISEAWHPRRVERILNLFGWDGLNALTGND